MIPPHKFDIPFSLGERVVIDGDKELVGVVTALCWRATMPEVEVSWIHQGVSHSVWMPPWRLTSKEAG